MVQDKVVDFKPCVAPQVAPVSSMPVQLRAEGLGDPREVQLRPGRGTMLSVRPSAVPRRFMPQCQATDSDYVCCRVRLVRGKCPMASGYGIVAPERHRRRNTS